ncbi:zinc ribbon domain-containing protein [Dysgonomonas sp. 25]|uniref:zinc ribbon domain-containing protein n=1 Tax=Dysgonomonas sp. 25 TaxID=2302933 RepID=UPI0013D13798|nr:zinc ribbon domain-containing protein [Dysgonomonas sp. 25]NDV68441.1 transcriptional regulator [Dysgonomonas sp. 25]
MEIKFCQSCGMPLNADADHGTNADQSLNDEYCTHCFQNGAFTRDCTMDEMIETCLLYLDEFNKDSDKAYTKEEARAGMKEFFPHLKRWAKA